MDLGGINVAWFADHHRGNSAGYQPISGNDYRSDDQDLPNICKTNRAYEVPGEGSEDFWEAAAGGGRYPSEEQPYVYYMGYAHTVDWVRVTVNVQQAGTYNVSSSWACANNPCGLSLWFNDGSGVVDNPDRPLDGEDKTGIVELDATNDYHIWRDYPNFTQVTLSAGPQVMTFNLEVADHLQYGFLQFDLVGGNPAGGAGGTGGAGGAGGDPGVGGAGGAAGGDPGVGGASAGTTNAGAPGAAGTTGTAAGAPGAAGTPGSAGSAGSATANTGGTTTTPTGPASNGSDANVDTESGCAQVRLASSSSASWLGLGLMLAAVSLARRRQRR
jgi:hypothetical protein